MVEGAIEALQEELNCLIAHDAETAKIYELSLKLDRLIVLYYNERGYALSGGDFTQVQGIPLLGEENM